MHRRTRETLFKMAGPKVPASLTEMVDRMESTVNVARFGAKHLSPETLVCIMELHERNGHTKTVEPAPAPVVVVEPDPDIGKHPVMVEWYGKQREAVLLGPGSEGRVKVQFAADGKETEVPLDRVAAMEPESG